MSVAALVVGSSFGCIAESTEHPQADPIEIECVDKDGDGYGVGCDKGPDCDDDDPAHHDDCPRTFADHRKSECEEGATEACKVILGVHNGVTDCFVGEHTCVDGEWSNCEDPS